MFTIPLLLIFRALLFNLFASKIKAELLVINTPLALITSSWFETGPITVYEAFAMKLPIIGTRLGGIEELCTHNFNSLLFDLNNHNELANFIISLINKPEKIDYLRSNLPKPRSPKDLAKEINDVYERLLGNIT